MRKNAIFNKFYTLEMKIMKKILMKFCLICALIVCGATCLTACGKDKTPPQEPPPVIPSTPKEDVDPVDFSDFKDLVDRVIMMLGEVCQPSYVENGNICHVTLDVQDVDSFLIFWQSFSSELSDKYNFIVSTQDVVIITAIAKA